MLVWGPKQLFDTNALNSAFLAQLHPGWQIVVASDREAGIF